MCVHLRTAVEDLSRTFGRPTLGRTVWFVQDGERVLSLHYSEDEALVAMRRPVALEVANEVWGKLTDQERRDWRRKFNALPAADWERYYTVAHFVAVSKGFLSLD